MKNVYWFFLVATLSGLFLSVAFADESEIVNLQEHGGSVNGVGSIGGLEKNYLELRQELEEQQELINNFQAENNRLLEKNNAISYADWAAIILTCVAILVTVLGVLLAILSIWGYRNITREARASAEAVSNETSSKIAKEQVESCINDIAKEELIKLIDRGELREHLENAVDMIYRSHGISGGVGGFGFGEYPELNQEDKES